MTHTTRFKASIFTIAIGTAAALSFSACKAPSEAQTNNAKIETVKADPQNAKLAPIRKALSCLPQEAAIIAAHRGTDERWKDIAENSIGGLKALIDHGTLMAEIDVAGLKDGTLIAFHDGVWDEISTGKGPIASSRKGDLETILLKSRAGKLTAERPRFFPICLRSPKAKFT